MTVVVRFDCRVTTAIFINIVCAYECTIQIDVKIPEQYLVEEHQTRYNKRRPFITTGS